MSESREHRWGSYGMIDRLRAEMGKAVVGQDCLIEGLLIGMLAGGHVLVEGRPGMAKTLAVTSLAHCFGGRFSRIQFTPDLLPSDLIGHRWYREETRSLEVEVGPICGNLILADEINRAPAKVQSALLEAMAEHQVTLGGQSIPLPEPYLVVATENPLEQRGTYALPEAQKDRFLLQVRLSYLSREEELSMLTSRSGCSSAPSLEQVMSCEDVLSLREEVRSVHLDPRLLEYCLDLVIATRPGESGKLSSSQSSFSYETDLLVEHGVSPRGLLGLVSAGRARAFLHGRDYALPEDFQALAVPVLAHRLIPSFEAEARGLGSVEIVTGLVSALAVP